MDYLLNKKDNKDTICKIGKMFIWPSSLTGSPSLASKFCRCNDFGSNIWKTRFVSYHDV